MNVNVRNRVLDAKWCIAIILLLALLLHTIRFSAVLPQNPDEAMYLRQARFISTLVRYHVGLSVPVMDADADGIWRYIQRSDWYAKPCWLHAALFAIPMVATGPHAGAALGVTILFSLATIGLLYWLTRKEFGRLAGLVAAGMLTVSHYWLVYARSYFAEVSTVFFVLAASACILLSREIRHVVWKSYVFAGMLAAAAVLSHYRVLFIVAPLGLLILLVSHGWRHMVARCFLFGAAFLAVILLFEGVTRMALVVVGGEEGMQTYLMALYDRYAPSVDASAGIGVRQTGWRPANIIDNLWHLLRWQGIAAFGLMLYGLYAACRKNSRKGTALLLMFVFPLLVFTLQVWVVARVLTIIIPFACMAVGIGVASLWARIDAQKKYGLWGLALLITFVQVAVLENLWRNAGFLQNETGYPDAVAWLDDQDIRTVYATNETRDMLGWYAPGLEVRSIRSLEQDAVLPPDQAVVFDGLRFHYYPDSRVPLAERERAFAVRARQQASFFNLTTTWQHFLYDGTQAHSVREMRADMQTLPREELKTIRIYTNLSINI